jgi:hypothetical protein
VKPVRELMKDPKVAAGLAAVALLFLVYRVTQSGKPRALPAAPDNASAASAPAAPADAAGIAAAPNGAFSPASPDNASAASVPRGGVAWNWERNPFIGPSRKLGAVAGAVQDEFPTIIVPGFGGNAPPAAAPAADARAAEQAPAEAEAALPELRGTVISGGRGIAIFGNRLVPPGEQVAGWTVDRVTAYDVSIRKGRERRTIGVFRPAGGKDEGGKP